MTTQPEQILEDNLIAQLVELGYTYIAIKDENDLFANFKSQLEKHNKVTLSDTEFKLILNHLNKGNVFDRAKILRDKLPLVRADKSGLVSTVYIEFIQQEHWCQNQYQVTRQVTLDGTYKNRFDVTILVNGLPLVQIELKKRGLELKEAFNQINRYQRHSFWASNGLFQYIQIFVISNGVNTKYYANNRFQSFKQTFYWSDPLNQPIRQLSDFTREFLEPCHMSKMITKYIVLHESDKILMVFRPYQYYATEAIIERVKTSHKNGYIWHTTGSGKTLTSFKASQILTQLPKVHKVVFVVDRKDLDYQTAKEFNSFSEGSIDGTDNTSALVRQFSDDTKLIVTTIQKLNSAITKNYFSSSMNQLKDQRIVFIFDECHRSQFGETHKRIRAFFNKAQLFGFTGTPIFAENAVKNELGKRTTKELFEECLHKYVITDAIKDENVLKFSVEYIGKYKQKEGAKTEIDIEVEGIDTDELLNSPKRLNKITDFILANHDRKTHSRKFTALFCVSSIENLILYYEYLRKRKNEGAHNLKIATIFSYIANEDDKDANGFMQDDLTHLAADNGIPYGTGQNIPSYATMHSREKLDEFIADYNKMFTTSYSTRDSQTYYNYYNDIAKRVKNCEIDILLVVNMYLTGFDSKPLNTLYVDKNLVYHGLVQAFSRTNRILNDQKSQGNIVCFRNLKQATDDAIALFSNKDAKDTILIEPYEVYVRKFSAAYAELLTIAPNLKSIDELKSEDDEMAFIKAFREIMRLRNVLATFADFTWDDLAMAEQRFNDYKSKYLDLFDKVKTNNLKEKVSILNDVDFELELIHRDEINVAYILRLLAKLKDATGEENIKQKKAIVDLLSGETTLRSKRELIEKFIEENLPHIGDVDDIPSEFENYWTVEQQKAFEVICAREQLDPIKLQAIIGDYIFTDRLPLPDEIVNILQVKPKLLERRAIVKRVIDEVVDFVKTFMTGMVAS
ncbi:MAG: type I restriction endonuclease subunit R [Bacteroidota bacterium]